MEVIKDLQVNCIKDDLDRCTVSLFANGMLTLYCTEDGNDAGVELSPKNARKLAYTLLMFAEESQCKSAKSSET